jgi:ATP-dependent RNA helicase DDX47/RRP3
MVDHYYVFLADRLKDACLVHLCNEARAAKQTTTIFTRSISETRRVCGLLYAISIGTISLHCDLSPSERAASLDKLRRKECYVIVTTDVAADLDPIPKVNRIINYSLTWKMTPQTYTQRTGNVVGHIGNSGQVVTLATQ